MDKHPPTQPRSRFSSSQLIESSARPTNQLPAIASKKRVDTSPARHTDQAIDAPGESAIEVREPPTSITLAGDAARFAWDEYLYGRRIRNQHTRRSYERATRRLLAWAESHGRQLHQITPGDVGRYLDNRPVAACSKKVELAAIRHLFDILVERHVVVLNPAASVRGDKHNPVEGRTPEITAAQVRKLLTSINDRRLIGLRDKVAISVLIYTAARVGAVSRLRVRDFVDDGEQYVLLMGEKGGKPRAIPVRHDLEGVLKKLLVGRGEVRPLSPDDPLFPSALRRTGKLGDTMMSPDDLSRMIRRRFRDAGLPSRLTAHSFRVATITDLLSQGVPLEDVQNLAGHVDPRTTRLYDRRDRKVTRNVVERISI